MKVTTHLHIVPTSRIVELYLHSPVCFHAAELKLKNNFIFASKAGVQCQLSYLFAVYYVYLLS
jgi:hypothetical protein